MCGVVDALAPDNEDSLVANARIRVPFPTTSSSSTWPASSLSQASFEEVSAMWTVTVLETQRKMSAEHDFCRLGQ